MHRSAVWVLVCLPLLAQTQGHPKIPDDLRFDVVSLKPTPNPAAQNGGGIRPAQGGLRYVANNCSIRLMITVAYRIKAEQIVGGPDWLDTDRWEMEGKAEKPSDADELHTMLMNMLKDRLKLQFHKSTKEMAMYALTVGKDGPKMTPHEAGNPGDIWIDVAQPQFLHMELKGMYAAMDYFAFRLSTMMDRPVVDMTGLKGGYDFMLKYTRDLPQGMPENAMMNGQPVDSSGPNVFIALKQQLGLELKAQKGPVPVIVIDRAERPTEN